MEIAPNGAILSGAPNIVGEVVRWLATFFAGVQALLAIS